MPSADVVVCVLGADERESIDETIASVRRYGLPVHVGVHRDRERLRGIEGVFQHPVTWTGDFAAARNQLLDQVASDYCLWLDSDETLFGFGDIDWSLVEGDLHAVKIQALGGHLPFSTVRLHRNAAQVRWSGRIHEMLAVGGRLPATPPRLLPGIAIVHAGYDEAAVLKVKAGRNAAIVRAAPDPDALSYGELQALARTETAAGRFSMRLWLQVWRHGERPPSPYFDPRHEAATMMAEAGYLRPLRSLLQANPLIVPLHLVELADGVRRTGQIDRQGLVYVGVLVRHALFDARYPFPSDLLGADDESLERHVRAMAQLWLAKEADMSDREPTGLDAGAVYRRSAAVESDAFEDDLILMHSGSWRAIALNPAAAVLWDALAWPQSPRELTQLLAEAAPDTPAETLAGQVEAVLRELLSNGFIEVQEA